MVSVQLLEASTRDEFDLGKALIQEYAAALAVDLCFQNFAEELGSLSKIYGPPRGCLVLARHGADSAGCVAVKDFDGTTCEMKRLYVRQHYRGLGVGRRLADAAIRRARELGYSRIVLDTLKSMTQANSLYGSLGFREIEAYYPNPLADVRYLTLDLSAT